MKTIAGLFVCLTLVLPMPASASDPAPGEQVPAELKVQLPIELSYLLYLPENYEEQDKWPLMLFLHGAGERGQNLDLVKVHGPPKLISQGKQFPFIVVSPQCPEGRWWESLELVLLLDEIVQRYNVDEDRIYVTGLSMGGFGTWRLAFVQPDRFAAIAPICGGGETYWTRRGRFSNLPIWAFHGAKDSVIPAGRSEEMVNAIRREWGNAWLTIYPDDNHDSWTENYNNPELYEWLLSHRRSAPEEAERPSDTEE
ncbi:MAG: dienelactone hydrolase family protein [Maioricimonas sp. JB049]